MLGVCLVRRLRLYGKVLVLATILAANVVAGFFTWPNNVDAGLSAAASLPTVSLTQLRLSGPDRYATAAALSGESFTVDQSAKSAVLVRGDVPSEGLIAGPLAAVLDGTVLLTRPGDLPLVTEKELLRVLPAGSDVWILGGEVAVSSVVAGRVQQLGFTPRRVDGATRVQTAARVAEEVLQRSPGSNAYLVNGWSVDALIASNVATSTRRPVLLSRQSTLDAALSDFLLNHPRIQLTAIGGPAVLSPSLISALQKNHSVQWLYGANRFATNILAINGMSPQEIAFGSADKFADLLVGGFFAGRSNIPLILMRESLSPETQQYLQANSAALQNEILIGGQASISSSLAKRLRFFRKTKAEALSLLAARVRTTAAQLPSGKFPFASTDPRGAWNFTVTGKDFVEGFWVDWLYREGIASGDTTLITRARSAAATFAPLATYPHHDRGMVFYASHAKLCDATGEAQFCDTAVQAADTLVSLFDPTLNVVTTTPGSREAIIDTTMNMPLLYWAATRTGNPLYRSIADQTNHTLANFLIRADGGTAQSVHFNPDGTVADIHTHQGFSDTSTWARGQAWAIFGLTQAYEQTNDTFYLDRVRALVDYVDITQTKYSGLWPYDFNASDASHADTSAMAIFAEGLLTVADVEPDPVRAANASAMGADVLEQVMRLALVPTLQTADPDGRLSQQTYTFPDSLEFIVGDYFLYQALTH